MVEQYIKRLINRFILHSETDFICNFSDLMRLLENSGRNNPGICIDDPRIKQFASCESALIERMLNQWPIGLFRMCAPQVCIPFWEVGIPRN